nr:hypothetical protein [Tanacetum cinerariifolium]
MPRGSVHHANTRTNIPTFIPSSDPNCYPINDSFIQGNNDEDDFVAIRPEYTMVDWALASKKDRANLSNGEQ